MKISRSFQIVSMVVVVIAVGVLLQTVFKLTAAGSDFKPEISLPILAVIGVLVVFLALTLVAVTFAAFNLSDRTQALALPEGSVRAVIALSLVMLFAILSVYLYGSLSRGGTIVTSAPLNRASKDDLTKKLGTQVLYTETAAGDPNPAADQDKATYKVHYRETGNPASEDFAKQMLVLLGTLVTAVSSFYFGAKTATSATSAIADVLGTRPVPKISSVDPSTWPVASGVMKSFKVNGSGLDVIKSVKIAMSGQPDVVATAVDPAKNVVTCSLPIGPNTQPGKWDVVLTDHDNKDTTSTGALTLT
jgi:hypothetical protein